MIQEFFLQIYCLAISFGKVSISKPLGKHLTNFQIFLELQVKIKILINNYILSTHNYIVGLFHLLRVETFCTKVIKLSSKTSLSQ